ncbi:MAG: hypothetical protein K6G00_03590 [Treponema sp.]|nr:hypothetical protein [Treponema sp.]
MTKGALKFFMLMTASIFTTALQAQTSEFKVLNVTPQGELPASVKYPSIQVQFSEPVTELKALGTPQHSSHAVSIEPELKGVFRWYGTSILSFESEEEMLPQKEYTVKVNPNLTSLKGSKIQGTTEYTFHTEDLKILSVHPGYEQEKDGKFVEKNSVPLQIAKDIAIFFNSPVNASVVKDFLTVAAGNPKAAKNLKFDAKQEDKSIIRLTVQDDIPEDTDITITLHKGAQADKDCYPSQKETKGNFHTLVSFKITDVHTQPSWYSEDFSNPVIIYFSTPLKENAEADLAEYIKTDLGVPVAKDSLLISSRALTIHNLPVSYGQTYNLTVKQGLTDIYGRKLDKDFSYPITVPPAKSFARFKNNGLQTMESQFVPCISFTHQNIKAPSTYTIESLSNSTGKKTAVKAKTVTLNPDQIQQDKIITEKIDLRPYLEQTGRDEYRGAVRFTASITYSYQYRDWKTKEYKTATDTMKNEQIIQVSDLAMTVRYGYNKAVVLVSSMSSGKPVEDAAVNVMFIPNKYDFPEVLSNSHPVIISARTDSKGIAEINFTSKQIEELTNEKCIFFEAKTDSDRLLYTPESNGQVIYKNLRFYTESAGIFSNAISKKMVAFMFTDRELYKPGETVSYIIADRNLQLGKYSKAEVPETDYTVELSGWTGRNSAILGTNQGKLSKQGTCWGTFTLPKDIKPGNYSITYSRNCDGKKSSESISINVQFFEKLRFEANSSIEDSTYVYGDTLSAQISANYLGGGSLADSSYTSRWRYAPATFQPKKSEYRNMRFGPISRDWSQKNLSSESGQLDDSGKASTIQETNKEPNSKEPRIYTVETQVTDSGNQAISTSTSTLVHPAQFYIGIGQAKNIKGFAKKGDRLTFEYVCITPEETMPSQSILPKAKEIKVELTRENWKRIQSLNPSTGLVYTQYEKEMICEETRTVKFPASGKKSELTVTPKESGTYLLKMTAEDSRGNPAVTETCFYVTGSDWYYHDSNDAQQVKLTADKDEYSTGETAHILMQTELPSGTYLITIEREGILSQKTINVTEPTSVLDVNIEDSYVPVIYVSVSTYSVRKKQKEELPKSYYGVTALHVNTDSKKIDIKIESDKKSYQPGNKAKITLTATQSGKPVKNASIALMAVDRGILDLINYHVQNPLEYFYSRSRFYNHTKGGDSRSLLIQQEQLTEEDSIYLETSGAINGIPRMYKSKSAAVMFAAADGSVSDEQSSAMAVRSNFEPTAIFEPALTTDKNGKATCTVTLPDSLTSYRITAVALEDDNFGCSENEISVCEPISVRTALPRMLRVDDKGELGVVISNLTNKAQSVSVQLNVYDGIEQTGQKQNKDDIQKLPGSAVLAEKKSGKKIKVAANKTQALMFSVKAIKQGWITVEFVITGNNVNEKILLPLQIEKPYIFETVTVTGTTENKAQEKILIPQDAEDGRYSLYVQLDPTRLGVLREAVSYVFHYPYGCMEQRSAAVLPLVAFGDYIHVFGLNSEVMYPKGVAEQEIQSWVSAQKQDGGFPYWKNGTESSPYVSMRIAEIAALAKQNGIPTGNIDLKKLASYLVKEAEHALDDSQYAWSLYDAAYASYAAALLGADVNDSILSAITNNDAADVESLELTALAYLAKNDTAHAEALAQKILSFTRMTSRGIDISQKYKNHRWCFFNDDSERYALLLQLFTKLNKKDNINPHCVYELLKMQKAHNGRWQSTAVTSRILIALNEYIKSNDLEHLDFTAEVLLNGSKELGGTFKGVTAQPAETTIVPKDNEVNVEFSKSGQGNLYYTASLKYAVPAEKQTARDEGLCVYTEITDVKTGKPVTGKELVAGNVYRQRVTVSSRIRAEYVAVRSPVPAGCEILNTAFVTTGTLAEIPEEDNAKKAYARGLSYKGIYDSEVQFFWNYFPAGVQQVEFQFRAVRSGEYHTPCTTAECMYEEEIFGRTDGSVWSIK